MSSSISGGSHSHSAHVGAVAGDATTATNNNAMNTGANSSNTTTTGTGAFTSYPEEKSFIDKSLARRAETGIDANEPSK